MIDPIELHAWADGEIGPENEAAIRKALDGSAAARAELESIVALKAVLQERIPRVEYSAQWRVCVGRLDEMDRVRRVDRLTSGRFAWGLSGLLFGAILVAGFLHRGTSSSSVTSADLARVLGTFAHERTKSTVSEGDKAALDDLLKSAKTLIDQHRLSVVGRAYADLDGHSATRYMLQDASGSLQLIVIPGVFQVDENGQVLPNGLYRALKLQTVPCVAWSDGRGTLMLAGERTFEDLIAVARGLH